MAIIEVVVGFAFAKVVAAVCNHHQHRSGNGVVVVFHEQTAAKPSPN